MRQVFRSAFVSILIAIARISFAQDWNQTSALNTNWAAIASSEDGTKLAAVVENGLIYTSSDAGATWQTNDVPALFWTSIASSSDGSRLAACAWSDGIYLSTNYGLSWQQAAAISNGVWQAIACSSDGNVIVAASLAYEWGGLLTTGPLSISTNAGATWANAGVPDDVWTSVTCSSNGMVIVAASGGTIYTTTNCGLTWATPDTPAESWSSVACSSDGTQQIAVSIGSGGGYGQSVLGGDGAIFLSTNSGVSWLQTSAPKDYWESIACSKDGTVLVAAAEEITPATTLWISMDSGATWTSNLLQDARVTVASSGHGAKLTAAFNYGGIYTWQWQPALNIGLSNQDIALSWPLSGIQTILQQNPILGTTNWTDVPVSNGVSQVVMPVSPGGSFYRLRIAP